MLWLEPEEWRALCHRHINGRTRFDLPQFCGEWISADDLNYGYPRICPRSSQRRPHLVGRLGSGPRHDLTDPPLPSPEPVTRPARGAWLGDVRRYMNVVANSTCAPLRPKQRPEIWSQNNVAIYRAAGFLPGATAEVDLTESGFPPRRSREVTHLCSDRVIHAKNGPCPRARDETGDIIRATGAQGLCIPHTSRPAGISLASSPRTCPAPNGRFGGSVFVTDPGNFSRAPKGFPQEILALRREALLRLILFLGVLNSLWE